MQQTNIKLILVHSLYSNASTMVQQTQGGVLYCKTFECRNSETMDFDVFLLHNARLKKKKKETTESSICVICRINNINYELRLHFQKHNNMWQIYSIYYI